MRRNALGKGLEALIPEPPQKLLEKEKPTQKGWVNLSIEKIRSNPYQPRTEMDQEKLKELSASIKEKGIIQPVVVRQVGEGFELVAGERRLRAAKKLGLKKVPAVITDKLSKEDMLEISLIENLQREDLNPIDTALGYQRLLEECGLSQRQLAEKIGKDRSSIANTLRLLSLPDEVKRLVSKGSLTEGHARAILSLSTQDEKIKLARQVVREDLSVRRTEDLVYGKKKSKVQLRSKSSPAFLEIETKLKQFFGTSVKVTSRGGKGKIEIEFYSEEDLSRILELLQITL